MLIKALMNQERN